MRDKLVIDFRDLMEEVCLWSFVLCNNRFEKLLVKRIIRRLNYALCRRADAIATVTESARKILEDALRVRVFVAPRGGSRDLQAH